MTTHTFNQRALTTITTGNQVATCLKITPSYIVIALDSGSFQVFDLEGCHKSDVKTSMNYICGLDVWKDDWVAVCGSDNNIGVWKLRNL